MDDRLVDDADIRPYTAADEREVDRFYRRLSAESSYTRFFCVGADAYRRATRGAGERLVLVATKGDEIVAIGEYDRSTSNPKHAEVAFAVLDRLQHHGLGTRLLHDLRRIAVQRGIEEFTAQVLVTNEAMMNVFRHADLPMHERLREGIYDVVLTL